MGWYTVQPGDCLASIARREGYTSWKTIYQHPDNAQFRKKRPDPSVIFPGDQLWLPEREPRQEESATDSRHTFTRSGEKTWLNLKIESAPDTPVEGSYTLHVAGRVLQGRLDQGKLCVEIPPDASDGQLVVAGDGMPPESAYVWLLKLGELDPLEEVSGVQGRLWNLGFDCGPVDNIAGPLTKAGVKQFQKLAFSDPNEWDGIAGPKTKEKLREHHQV